MATNAHTEVPSKKPFPPFEREYFPSQLFWLVITFVVLYVMIWKIALPRISNIIEARRTNIEGDLAKAARHRKEADAVHAAHQKTLADARVRAQAVTAETHDQLNAQLENTRRELEAKLNAKLTEAEKKIAVTKSAAMANVNAIAAEAATAIVQRLSGIAPAAASVESAVAGALKR